MSSRLKIRSNGFLTLEISLVIIISALLLTFVLSQQARSAKRDLARIQADQLQQIADALNSYTDLYRRELVNGNDLLIDLDGNGTTDVEIPIAPPAGTQEGSKLTPTIENLIQANLLSENFQNRPAASNGKFVTRLRVFPDPCPITPDNCRVEGYVSITEPVTSGGNNNDGDYDGDILGDILGFLGGNGFATLQADTLAINAGGNFTVGIDFDNDGVVDVTSDAGLVGVRVGATASRFDVRDPVPGVDFCAGDKLIVWPVGDGVFNPPAPVGGSASIPQSGFCGATVLSDTPVGYRFVQTDANTGGSGASSGGGGPGGGGADPGGSVLLRCIFDENNNPPAQFIALSYCCEQGNSQCTPPDPNAPVASSTTSSSSSNSSSTSSTTTTTTTSSSGNGKGGSNGNSGNG